MNRKDLFGIIEKAAIKNYDGTCPIATITMECLSFSWRHCSKCETFSRYARPLERMLSLNVPATLETLRNASTFGYNHTTSIVFAVQDGKTYTLAKILDTDEENRNNFGVIIATLLNHGTIEKC